jgi:mannose-6-phosphate isomerase-like protein (cupin superfamily)
MDKYTIVDANDAKDFYEDSDVPGEFRRLGDALGTQQIALSLIRIPPHSDFEQSTGHSHDDIEEIYLVTSGTLTMRFNDDIKEVKAGSAVRISPETVRSHRNEGDETVNLWAISVKNSGGNSHKVDDFWEASKDAKQSKSAA